MIYEKIYIVILNYNGWKDTIECLESVLKNGYRNYQIIVVDNDSSNNSMEHMLNWANGLEMAECANVELENLSKPHSKKPILYKFYTKAEILEGKIQDNNNDIIFIQAGENGGFAAGNNIAIQYALHKNDFEYIWLLNNDTVIEPDALSKLADYAKQNSIGICGSTLMYYHEKDKVQAYGGRVHKFFGTSSHILDKKLVKDIDYVVGASFLIDKKVIDKIDLLPEEYFLYYEETDYCFNATKNGFELGVALDSIVYHKEGGSTGANSNARYRSEFSDVLLLKNRIKFHRKYLGGGIGLWMGMCVAFINRIRRGQIDRIVQFFVNN